MGAPAFLEIFQDPAIELEDLPEPDLLHVRPRLFAADASGAEHDDGMILHLPGKLSSGPGKIAEMLDSKIKSSLECSEFDFAVIPRVQQSHWPPLIQPLLQGGGGEFWGRVAAGVDSLHPERDDFLFDQDQHAGERLPVALAVFWLKGFESADAADLRNEVVDALSLARHKQVDASLLRRIVPFNARSLHSRRSRSRSGFKLSSGAKR